MAKLSDGRRNELEKAVMQFLRDREYKATKWDAVAFISGYEPDCTAKEVFEIVRWFADRGIIEG